MTDLNKIKATIASLLAKAEKSDHPAEAATFMAKVNELLEKYQIEIWELPSHEDKVGQTRGDAGIFASMSWGKHMLFAVAKYFHCEAVTFGHGAKHRLMYSVVGRESCRMTCELMLPYIISQVRQQARTMAKRYEVEGREITKSRAERMIADSLTTRIWRALHDRRANDEQRVADTNDFSGKALVLRNEVESFMETAFPKAKEARKKDFITTPLSRELAGQISLNHQATGRGATKLLA